MTDLEHLNQIQDILIEQGNLIDKTFELLEQLLIDAENGLNIFGGNNGVSS